VTATTQDRSNEPNPTKEHRMTAPTRNRARAIDPEEFSDDTAPFDEPAPRSARPRRDEEAPRPRAAAQETGDEDADGEETIIPVIAKGRDAINASRPSGEAGSGFFKWPDDGGSALVKFLDVEPWSYLQHWVTRKGKQSFPCIGAGCPLCDIGVKVSQKVVYTVLNLSADSGPTVQVLEVTPTLDETLANYDADKKTGPLPRLYWALSRTKAARSNSFAKYNYNFLPVKERDLEEDWGISPDAADAALDGAEAPTAGKMFGKITRRMLQEVADEVIG
jgi:hypothetical protein